jgi:hypothetical protein
MVGLNEEAFTFNLAVVGDTGVAMPGAGLVVAVVVPVAGVVLPFTFSLRPTVAAEVEPDVTDGIDVCFVFEPPLKGGID